MVGYGGVWWGTAMHGHVWWGMKETAFKADADAEATLADLVSKYAQK